MGKLKLLLIMPYMFIYGVQREPYLPEPYTFEFKNSYAYQYIPSIDQAINPIDFHSNNNFCFSSLIALIGKAKQHFSNPSFDISLSHTDTMATAFVIAYVN